MKILIKILKCCLKPQNGEKRKNMIGAVRNEKWEICNKMKEKLKIFQKMFL